MIPKSELQHFSQKWNIEDHIIEKDYVLGLVLWGIGNHKTLSKELVLKGGSAIKKCFVDTHRYSQDLDFTVLPINEISESRYYDLFSEVLDKVNEATGLDFNVRDHNFSFRPNGQSIEGKIYYKGPRGNPTPTSLKIDMSFSEDLIRPQVYRPIIHQYSDKDILTDNVYCYSFEEIFAEKIRALLERSRPRDLYDIVYLYRRSDLHAEPDLIKEVLDFKCSLKDVDIPSTDDFKIVLSKSDLFESWEPMLSRSVGTLPEVKSYWDELPAIFSWLNGEEYEVELVSIAEGDDWIPAPVTWERGESDLIEPIRHSAVNRLVVNLGYKSSFRLVEPYSLRTSREGKLLFYGLKLPRKEIRCYRVDRIQSIKMTRQPFDPVFAVEFTPRGRIPVSLTKRRRRFSSSSSKNRYVVECAVCGKRFRRKLYSTKINPHKHKDFGTPCYGRYGYLA